MGPPIGDSGEKLGNPPTRESVARSHQTADHPPQRRRQNKEGIDLPIRSAYSIPYVDDETWSYDLESK